MSLAQFRRAAVAVALAASGLGLVYASGVAGSGSSAAAQDVGADAGAGVAAPDFSATATFQMTATTHPLVALRGRLVLITFFAPWSERCVAAVPHLNKLRDRWGGHGLSVLAVAEGTLDQLRPWAEEHAVEYGVAALATLEYEKVSNAFSVPGLPHAALISPDGKIVWSGHPQSLKDPGIEPHLKGITSPPTRLPVALASQQALLADGRWAEAQTGLRDARDGLDKVSKRWADGLIAWIDARRASWLTDAADLESAGRHWDAWQMYADFGRRFSAMEGAEDAAAQAAAIRADAAAKKELAAGDDVARAKDLLAAGKTRAALLILKRVVKQARLTVHAARAQALIDDM